MNKNDFIGSFETQVHLEIDKMNLDGDAPEAFYCATIAKLFFEYLKDAQIGLLDFEACSYYSQATKNQGEISLNGYYISDDLSELHLFTVVKAEAVGTKVSSSDIHAASDKAYRFYKRSVTNSANPFYSELDEAMAPHTASKAIFDAANFITSVNVYVFTDGECERIRVKSKEIEGISLTPQFWDIERLYKQMISGSEREEIIIDLKEEHGRALPAMKMEEQEGGYDCYLGFISGDMLAKMYSKYSSRLIEQNVRMYLQARGKVNSGIQSTIKEHPGRFLAYNNGLSLTAKSIEVSKLNESGQCQIDKITELQIVNGAQTSGSIFHAFKKEKKDVSRLRVQFKLTVPTSTGDMVDLVSAISRYSNSQNAVKVTDLSANHPYHIELEKLSRSIHTPNKGDGSIPTRWYYERARGAYMIDKGNHPGAAWLRQNPQEQMFTKVDLGKSEVTFWGQPHTVSRGGEKNFVHFMEEITEKNPVVNETAFKEIISRLILYRGVEEIVKNLKQGGYKANVVVYSLSYIYLRYHGEIDFKLFWSKQFNGLTDNFKIQLSKLATEAYKHIINPPPGISNLGEWAKKKECWETFNSKNIELNLGPDDGFGQRRKAPGRVSGNNLEGAMAVPRSWQQIAQWAKNRDDFTRRERGFIQGLIALTANKESLTAAQLRYAKSIWEKADKAGFAFKK